MTNPVHYTLDAFPPKTIQWERLLPLISQAHVALARYDSLLAATPNADVLLSPLTVQEAVLSSKIEGIDVTMSEVLELEAGDGKELAQSIRDDAGAILNYRLALSSVADALRDGVPLTLHLLREARLVLVHGVDTHNKSPSSLRQRQNWIGPPGCAIEDASFVPIPQQQLHIGVEHWSGQLQIPPIRKCSSGKL